MPANTGVAGAIHRVACFAGLPAPTGYVPLPMKKLHHQMLKISNR